MTEAQTQSSCTHERTTFSNGFEVCCDCAVCVGREYVPDLPQLDGENKPILHRAVFPTTQIGSRTVFNPHNRRFKRLHRINQSITDPVESAVADALKHIRRFFADLGIEMPSPVFVDAEAFLKEIYKKRLFASRKRVYVAATALYLALRQQADFITISEFVKTIKINRKLLQKYIGIAVKHGLVDRVTKTPIDQVLPRCLASLELFTETEKQIYNLMEFLAVTPLKTKTAKAVGAAATYLVCQELKDLRTQREISHAFHVSEVTIRNRMKEIKEIWGAWRG
jgi:transcription initiation factor TFIIB